MAAGKTNTTLYRVRLGWALLGIVGLGLQASATYSLGAFGSFTQVVNFFSYFTILSNIFITAWFVLAFLSMQRGQARWWGDDPAIKGALLVAGGVTIIVYWLLLKDIPVQGGPAGDIANLLLHGFVPLGLWIDWLIAGDPMNKPYGAMMGAWLVYPIVFMIYSEIRGPFVDKPTHPWYPYFFLSPSAPPAGVGGVGPLILALIGVSLIFFLAASVLYWLYRKRGGVQFVPVGKAQVSRAGRRR
ncbi:MAG: Pr6Pr family membrane protein [Ktedonobacterales bacterium]